MQNKDESKPARAYAKAAVDAWLEGDDKAAKAAIAQCPTNLQPIAQAMARTTMEQITWAAEQRAKNGNDQGVTPGLLILACRFERGRRKKK